MGTSWICFYNEEKDLVPSERLKIKKEKFWDKGRKEKWI